MPLLSHEILAQEESYLSKLLWDLMKINPLFQAHPLRLVRITAELQ